MVAPDFTRKTAETLFKRAASMCSNPSCRAITSGPNDDPDGVVRIGDAAHIYGARPSAKRFRSDLTDSQRANVTNGIWLCRNCPGKVDADEAYYTADVLFDWRRAHEAHVLSLLGRQTGKLSSSVDLEFERETHLARRIVDDRPFAWEYRLLAELLKSQITRPIRRSKDLRAGLYTRPKTIIKELEAIDWIRAQIDASIYLMEPLPKLINVELAHALGPSGIPGDPIEILHVCRLIGEATQSIVTWEESVLFAQPPNAFIGIQSTLSGVMAHQLAQLATIPTRLDSAIDRAEEEPGVRHEFLIEIVFEVPAGWGESMELEISKLSEPPPRRRWWL
jgi:hypothetical protein